MSQAQPLRRARRTSLWTFGFASLLTICLGGIAMLQGGVPLGVAIRNPVAWFAAGALAIFLARRGWLASWAAPAAVAVIAFSFLGPGQEGVHRWIGPGPIQLNAAALMLPLAIAVFDKVHVGTAVVCFALIAVLLALQPDISQLAGFALASMILAAGRFGWSGVIVSAGVAAAAIMLCLLRPDPLEPLPHVEGVFALAWSQSPVIAAAMAACLAAATLGPLTIWTAHPRGGLTPLALSAYLAATALAPAFGAYPVPLAGYGLSFVTGWWLGLAALAAPRTVNSLTSS